MVPGDRHIQLLEIFNLTLAPRLSRFGKLSHAQVSLWRLLLIWQACGAGITITNTINNTKLLLTNNQRYIITIQIVIESLE